MTRVPRPHPASINSRDEEEKEEEAAGMRRSTSIVTQCIALTMQLKSLNK